MKVGAERCSAARKMLEVSDRRAKYILEKMENAKLLHQEGRQKAHAICCSDGPCASGER
jgi:hypothetical protein